MSLRKCPICRKYSLKEICCTKTVSPHPLPYTGRTEKYRKMVKNGNDNKGI